MEILADEAEGGYDVSEIIARLGKCGRLRRTPHRQRWSSSRLDPELKERLARRATTGCSRLRQ